MKHALVVATVCVLAPLGIADGLDDESPRTSAFGDDIREFALDAAHAPDVVRLLDDQFNGVKFSAEPNTNRIYGRVPEDQLDEVESFIRQLDDTAQDHRLQQEELRRQEAAERAAGGAGDELQPDSRGWEMGLEFQVPFGMRHARESLRNAQLRRLKLLQTYGPKHPSVRQVDRQIEVAEQLLGDQVKLHDLYKIQWRNNATVEPPQLAQIVKQLRPGLDVEVEGLGTEQVIFRGSEEAVAEAERILKALEAVVQGTDPASLRKRYEDAERDAAGVADQLRKTKGSDQPDETQVGELRDRLRDRVQSAFDLRLHLQRTQLEQAEADLATARARLVRREQLAERIVERRIEELESGDDLSWRRLPSADELRPVPEMTESGDGADATSLPPVSSDPTAEQSGWERVAGLRLGAAVPSSNLNQKYRGGFRVDAVLRDSAAEHAGIRAGDVLVGAAGWEVVSQDNLTYILDHMLRNRGGDGFVFVVIRNGQALRGLIEPHRMREATSPPPQPVTPPGPAP